MTKTIYQEIQDLDGNVLAKNTTGENLILNTVGHNKGQFNIWANKVTIETGAGYRTVKYDDGLALLYGSQARAAVMKGRNTKGNRAKAIEAAKEIIKGKKLVNAVIIAAGKVEA